MNTVSTSTAAIDKLVPGEQYVHLGVDTAGAHHHYLGEEETIVVTPDRYERIESGIRIYYRVRSATVEHVESGITPPAVEQQWCPFVEKKRGWRRRTNRIYDVTTAVAATVSE